ncbi:MAG TPA: bifunctional DNA-formamidopyrimidine glycosylase/DNA-(apurinic or apyrimidinic site) lyase [Luteimonas sp.]|nr:bifunctional DNA-formamidopyrimidine glycosylase/DNA-(apurinic or apyrimidinic site) lyase [Luteimonas sp.]
MPELPEVETTRRGLLPHVVGRTIAAVILRRADLRWPIPPEVSARLPGQRVLAIRRRAKYLLVDTQAGSALLHLGMSGSLRVLAADTPLRAHDHVDLLLAAGPAGPAQVLRFNDPRRFGCLLWQPVDTVHPLLQGLGPEPLSDAFNGDHLFARSRGRRIPVKAFLMDQAVVVGVGNIYVAEALFEAGVSPLRAAGRISAARYARVAAAIRRILTHAITRGGTTLRDFISPDGAPGYFEQELTAYGRHGQPCTRCGRALKHAVLAQRATVWCAHCQR